MALPDRLPVKLPHIQGGHGGHRNGRFVQVTNDVQVALMQNIRLPAVQRVYMAVMFACVQDAKAPAVYASGLAAVVAEVSTPELAKATGLHEGDVRNALKKLAADGLIHRQKGDARHPPKLALYIGPLPAANPRGNAAWGGTRVEGEASRGEGYAGYPRFRRDQSDVVDALHPKEGKKTAGVAVGTDAQGAIDEGRRDAFDAPPNTQPRVGAVGDRVQLGDDGGRSAGTNNDDLWREDGCPQCGEATPHKWRTWQHTVRRHGRDRITYEARCESCGFKNHDIYEEAPA